MSQIPRRPWLPTGRRRMTEAHWLGCRHPAPLFAWLMKVDPEWNEIGPSDRPANIVANHRLRVYRRLRLLCAALMTDAASGCRWGQGALLDDPIAWLAGWMTHLGEIEKNALKFGQANLDRASSAMARAADLVRDIFGNPFRPVTLCGVTEGISRTEPTPDCLNCDAILTPTVRNLAGRIYDDRDHAAMPVLADALEDAGCTEATILGHLRTQGPHVRGCWVIDLLLGKE